MGRGGLSKDPEVRKRQLAALQAGRETAKARRAAGLPTKRREGQSDNAGSPAKRRVKQGTYQEEKKPRGKTTPATRQRREPGNTEQKPKVGRVTRAYGKLLGFDI